MSRKRREPGRDLMEGKTSTAALLHLLGGCLECAGELERLLDPPEPGEKGEAAASRAIEAALAAVDRARVEAIAAPHLVRRLLRHPPGRRVTLVRSSWQFQLPKVVELLCDRSRRSLGSDPGEAVALAELAVDAADRLPRAVYGDVLAFDLEGRARVYQGLALRKVGDLPEAEGMLREAEKRLRGGSRDLAEKGWLLEVRGSLRTRQRRLEEALCDYRGALRCYRRAADRDRIGRVYLRIARAWWEAEDEGRSARVFALTAAALDSTTDRRLAMALAHNLLEALLGMGERDRALAVLREAIPAYELFAKPAERFTLRWTEARVHARAGDLERAAVSFRLARDGFLELGLAVDGTLCCLEWALIQAQRGRPDLVAEVAAEMKPIFESRRLAREALAALSLFRQAAEEHGATAQMIRAVARVVVSKRAKSR